MNIVIKKSMIGHLIKEFLPTRISRKSIGERFISTHASRNIKKGEEITADATKDDVS